MFRRVFSSLASLGGGSLRKRLYVRLTAAAVLLALSVWGIAHLQKATKSSKDKAKQTAAANSKKTKAKKTKAESPDRRPQPVPDPDDSVVPVPDAGVIGSTYASLSDDDSTAEDPSYEYSDNNNPAAEVQTGQQGGSRYALTDATPYDPTSGDESEAQAAAAIADESVDPDASSSAAEAATTSSSDTSTILQDVVADASQETAQDSGGNRYSSSDEPTSTEQANNGASIDAAATDVTTSDSEEPARLIIPTDEETESAAADVSTQEAETPGLVKLDQQRASPQPLRSGNIGATTSSSSANAPPLLGNMNRVSPLTERSSASAFSSPPPPVALPPNSGVDAATAADLEGVQVPSMFLEKTAPDEVQVGRPARFEIFVRNVGKVTANHVVVTDQVPEGATLVETNPPAENLNGMLVWKLGTMEPGAEAQLSLTVTPQVEGYIGSVAQVSFAAQAAARTISTKPELIIEVEAPEQVLIGDWVTVAITVRNEGTGPARGVVIEDDVPEGLSHPAGRELEHELGTLRPGEQRPLNLVLAAEKAGIVTNIIRVRDDGAIDLSESTSITVVAPQLAVAIEGPRLRYLDRQATYNLGVTNTGTAVANNVEMVAWLPTNLQFVSADKLGQYDARQHAVYWNLEALPPQKTGAVKLVTLPVQEGGRELRVEAHADLTSSEPAKQEVTVESVSELSFSIADSADPIEVGSETVYEIEVTNQGSKTDRDIVLALLFPDELQPIRGEGPTQVTISEQQVQFAPLGQLAAGASVIFRVQAQGRAAGDARVLVQLASEQMPKPVSKEENTKVYTD